MYTEDDFKAAFLILEAADQGRPVEFAAQFLASYIVSGEIDTATSLSFISAVLKRTDELMCGQLQIWPGLLPGIPNEHYPPAQFQVVMKMEGKTLAWVDLA